MTEAEKNLVLLKQIAHEHKFSQQQVENVIKLLEEGNTVPFIARYRKEQTNQLDEVQIRTIMEKWEYLQNLEKRKEEVLRLIDEQGKLDEELSKKINAAVKLQEVEDLYRPYKQKRKTKASVAKEKGLEPFAKWLFELPRSGNVNEEAAQYLSEEKELHTIEDVLQGGNDIIAEWIADRADFRSWIREKTFHKGRLITELKDKEKDEKGIYEMYYEYEEPIKRIVPHRTLAVNRGEKDGVIKVSIVAPVDEIEGYLQKRTIGSKQSPAVPHIIEAYQDAYKRLIQPSIEREIRNELTEKAEEQAIHIFSENLRHLLLQPPLKGKMTLGVDPAYRTGCKLAVINETGKVAKIDVIYPHPPVKKRKEAFEKLTTILKQHDIEIIAIGNGTASRETEQFVAETIQNMKSDIAYLIVNEAGASVYSASDLAREEFPELQVEERSAVSIARRLQDPLAELVKIDPKSVGVGQYQHDVSQRKLNDSLTFVVETVVNQVGVNVNTASSSLLQYVSGLSKTVANNVVKKREEEGRFTNRAQLKKIPRLGAKTYEQSIGFLRILDGKQPLDRTPIHPESYAEAEKLLAKIGCSVNDIGTEKLAAALKDIDLDETAAELEIGKITLSDMIDALKKPGRDPRDELAAPLLKKDILKLEDLTPGMELEGTVRNVVDFGAFVDIGVKEDGLVHISKISKSFVRHPMDKVSVGEVVKVWVEKVDKTKGRVSLTMLPPNA